MGLKLPLALKPLSGKYYGTEIVDADGEHVCTIWDHSRGDPGLSEREMAVLFPSGGHPLTDAEKVEAVSEWMCDAHYESIGDYEVARLIVEAVNKTAQ